MSTFLSQAEPATERPWSEGYRARLDQAVAFGGDLARILGDRPRDPASIPVPERLDSASASAWASGWAWAAVDLIDVLSPDDGSFEDYLAFHEPNSRDLEAVLMLWRGDLMCSEIRDWLHRDGEAVP